MNKFEKGVAMVSSVLTLFVAAENANTALADEITQKTIMADASSSNEQIDKPICQAWDGGYWYVDGKDTGIKVNSNDFTRILLGETTAEEILKEAGFDFDSLK